MDSVTPDRAVIFLSGDTTRIMAQDLVIVLTFCRSWAFTLLVFAYFFYVAIGGVIFMELEQAEQDLLVADVRELRVKFLEKNRCVTERSLERLLQKILVAGKRGVLKTDSDEYNFDFTSSLFFVTTFLMTTGELQKTNHQIGCEGGMDGWSPLINHPNGVQNVMQM